MKTVMWGNVIIQTVFIICIAAAAIYFDNPNMFWWFMVLPFLGYEYRETPINRRADNEQREDVKTIETIARGKIKEIEDEV